MLKVCSVENCGRKAAARGLCYRHYVRLRRTGKLTTTRHMGDFWEKVAKGTADECWPWTGYVKPSGHGLTHHKRTVMHASRKAWILTHGEIRGALGVLHRCDNALCCNPAHMYLGTRVDNMIDLWDKTPAEERATRGDRISAKLTNEQVAELYQMRLRGASIRECVAKFGIRHQTIYRIITAWRRGKLAELRRSRMSA